MSLHLRCALALSRQHVIASVCGAELEAQLRYAVLNFRALSVTQHLVDVIKRRLSQRVAED